jgi:arginase
MKSKNCKLVGLPVQTGTYVNGCLMGPDAYRTAGIEEMIVELGHKVEDIGNLALPTLPDVQHANASIHDLAETAAWADKIQTVAYDVMGENSLPIFLGGDHSISIGTVPGVAKHAAENNQKQYVLWLDAHPDFHTLETTQSGNLHGTPVAYFSGMSGFEGVYPALTHPVDPKNICMMGLRSVDNAEHDFLNKSPIEIYDMRSIDEYGVKNSLKGFLDRVTAANGALHVSLDVDFLEPAIAPAVGTTVPGGATFREAHLIMEMLSDSGLVTSLDMVELNPFLDERGRTANLMVDLCASLLGRRVFDRPTHSL